VAVTISWALESRVLIITTTPSDFANSLEQLDRFLQALFAEQKAPIDIIHDARALDDLRCVRNLMEAPVLQHPIVRQSIFVPTEHFSALDRFFLRFTVPRSMRPPIAVTLLEAAAQLWNQDRTLTQLVQNVQSLTLTRLFASNALIPGTLPISQTTLRIVAKPTDSRDNLEKNG
jgi:hypothetical protein